MKQATRILHVGRPRGDARGQPVNPPVMHASTVLFPTVEAYEAADGQRYSELSYGRHGTSTSAALENALAELEGGYRAIVLPSGLSAISAALLAFARPGAHVLVTDAAYGPTRNLCENVLHRFGVDVEYYDPRIGAGIAGLVREETTAIYCESPGTASFEVQDIPAIAAAVEGRDIPILNDNTWATPCLFPSFERGVDISIHAGTKYIVGHSDAMLGVVVCNERYWRTVRDMVGLLGYATSPDDCYLALRGLRTLSLRLEKHEANGLAVARWLEGCDMVERVLYPALESDPDHALWKRDFRGACGLLGFRLKVADRENAVRFCNALELFGIGASWGGYESLVSIPKPTRKVSTIPGEGALIRIHVGLEDCDDLIADLKAAMETVAA